MRIIFAVTFDKRYMTLNPFASYVAPDSRMLRGESRIRDLRTASAHVHSRRTKTGCVLFVSRFITHMNDAVNNQTILEKIIGKNHAK